MLQFCKENSLQKTLKTLEVRQRINRARASNVYIMCGGAATGGIWHVDEHGGKCRVVCVGHKQWKMGLGSQPGNAGLRMTAVGPLLLITDSQTADGDAFPPELQINRII